MQYITKYDEYYPTIGGMSTLSCSSPTVRYSSSWLNPLTLRLFERRRVVSRVDLASSTREREREREYGSYAKSKQRIFLGLGQPFNLPMASMKTLLNYILNPSKRCCHLLRAHMASANISETLILIPFDTCSVLECVCVLNSIAAFTYTPALRSHTVSLAQSLDEELLLELKVLLLLLWFYLKYPCWEWENMAS